MPVRVIFRCQFCAAVPGPETQRTLEGHLREWICGEHLDAFPELWLVWHGHGPFGPTRYACPEHRGELTAYLREHYGAFGPQAWKRPPYEGLPIPAARALLACGAELKSTFCLARGGRAWVGHHNGDLGNAETLEAFREGIAHFEALFSVTPAVVAHDLHPDYLSTSYALAREGVDLVGVQHHIAYGQAAIAAARSG